MAQLNCSSYSYKTHCMFYKSEAEKRNKRVDDSQAQRIARIKLQYGQTDLFSPIQSKYDYFDELVGSTIVPVILVIDLLALIGSIIWFSSCALYLALRDLNVNVFKDNAALFTDVLNKTWSTLVLCMCPFKCALSLLTRPIATVCYDVSRITSPFLETVELYKQVITDRYDEVKTAVQDTGTDFYEAIASFGV